MSICFNRSMASGSAAGYNDSKLRPGFFGRLLIYLVTCNSKEEKKMSAYGGQMFLGHYRINIPYLSNRLEVFF